MKIPILTYQPMHIHGAAYRDNHLKALASDLRQITEAGFKIVPLRSVVDAWFEDRGAELEGKLVALASDDGADFDYIDLPHPTAGTQRSVFNLLCDFAAENPGKQDGLHITSFVIASPEARAALDAACMMGKGWWTDGWWRDAAQSGLMHIANHSWDHNHGSLPSSFSQGVLRGTFSTIDSKRLADHEIRRAADYLRANAPNPGTALFAYPYGQTNRYLVEEYFPRHGDDLGIRAAFAARPAFLQRGTSRWEIPRFVCGRDWASPAGLQAILDAAGSDRNWVPVRGQGNTMQEFRDFFATRVDPIPGWLYLEAAVFTAHLASAQRKLEIAGPTLEIGVFQGKYLAVLYQLSRSDEIVIGVDLFLGAVQKQQVVEAVQSNIAAACGDHDRLRIVVADSLELTGERLLKESNGAAFRFVSIDGGHTRELVRHDLEVTYPVLEAGGIMALDDAFNTGTPGVIEGIAEFFLRHKPRLAPFAFCYNKLFVTTPDFHARYLEATLKFVDEVDLPTNERTREQRKADRANGFTPEMFGYEIVTFAY